jgi:hypothetical protein
MFFCNREARQVPLWWNHPQDTNGNFIGMFPEDMPDCSVLPEEEIGICAYDPRRYAD